MDSRTFGVPILTSNPTDFSCGGIFCAPCVQLDSLRRNKVSHVQSKPSVVNAGRIRKILAQTVASGAPDFYLDSSPAHSGTSKRSRTERLQAAANDSSPTEVKPKGLTYKDAGVDIDAGAELVRRIAKLTPGIGGFGGLFPFGDSYLVAGTDGVGTKLKLAFEMDKHDTIGIDLVAMSVNDIITLGAKPLFFLDYFATSSLDVDQAEQVISGIVEGCNQSDCALLGGETAEMPGFYGQGEYDLSGFAVGAVKKEAVIEGRKSGREGDKILGLPSSGVHSNGFSLVRKVLSTSGASLSDPLPHGSSASIGEALLAPTVIYVKQILSLLSECGHDAIHGIAHITGGGFTDNIPRVLPEGLAAKISVGSWQEPPIFPWLRKTGNISEDEMRRTFNLGIGMVLVVSPEAADKILSSSSSSSSHEHGPVLLIGEVVKGEEGVIYVEGQ